MLSRLCRRDNSGTCAAAGFALQTFALPLTALPAMDITGPARLADTPPCKGPHSCRFLSRPLPCLAAPFFPLPFEIFPLAPRAPPGATGPPPPPAICCFLLPSSFVRRFSRRSRFRRRFSLRSGRSTTPRSIRAPPAGRCHIQPEGAHPDGLQSATPSTH